MAKGGAPAVILKGQNETIKELEHAITAVAGGVTELGAWAQMFNELIGITAERLGRLEEAVFGVDYEGAYDDDGPEDLDEQTELDLEGLDDSDVDEAPESDVVRDDDETPSA